MRSRCYIVPPHLLRGIAESSQNSEKTRKAAQASLAAHDRVTSCRKDRLAALNTPRGYSTNKPVHFRPQHIIPDTLLRHVAESDNCDEPTRARAKRDLEHLEKVLAKVKSQQQSEFR